MSRFSLKKIALYLLAILIFISVMSFGWVEYQLRRMRGTYVQRVDPSQFQVQTEPIAIRNIHVLTPDASSMVPDQTVLLDKGKIIAIDEHLVIPHNATIIEGHGKFLIPGLVDSHVHFKNSHNDLLLYLANGVTSIRDMGGKDSRLNLRRKIEKGQLGPDMFLTSAKVHSKSGFKAWFSSWTRSRIHLADPQRADAYALKLLNKGYDGIKMSSFTDPEVYRALASAGQKHGLAVTGHIPNGVSLDDVWESGQNEVAHVEEFLKALDREFGGFYAKDHDEFLDFLKKRGPEIADKLKAHQIVVATTHWIISSLPEQKFNLEPAIKSVALAYANPNLIEGTRLSRGWLPGNNSYAPGPENFEDPKRLAMLKKFWATYAKGNSLLTEIFAKEGVTLMAGTDANTPLVVPGFSLHDELESLVSCGLTPSQVLYAATVAPNQWMNRQAGIIQKGYQADLVLLDKNPLENIANTRAIDSVISQGRWLDRTLLANILMAVKQANDESRNVDIDPWIRDSQNLFP